MLSYIVKRLLLMVPTLFGVLLITFAVIQFVPGGPVEQMVSQLQGRDSGGEGGYLAAMRGSGGLLKTLQASAAAATEMRKTSRVRIAILNPSPPAPSRRDSGTRHPSKRSRASGCGAITAMRAAIDRPGVSASTTKALMPRAPGASPLRAKTT